MTRIILFFSISILWYEWWNGSGNGQKLLIPVASHNFKLIAYRYHLKNAAKILSLISSFPFHIFFLPSRSAVQIVVWHVEKVSCGAFVVYTEWQLSPSWGNERIKIYGTLPVNCFFILTYIHHSMEVSPVNINGKPTYFELIASNLSINQLNTINVWNWQMTDFNLNCSKRLSVLKVND